MAFLAAWAVVLFLVAAGLMAGHWVVLPRPGIGDERLGAAMAQVSAHDDGNWTLTHVLYAECRCSQRVIDYLLTRTTPPGVLEQALLVGDDETLAKRLADRGIRVVAVSQEELESQFNISSAPLLLISNQEGEILYSGGYTSRKQGPDYRDIALLAALQSDEPVANLPVYGCGVGRDLQQILDPLGMKYP